MKAFDYFRLIALALFCVVLNSAVAQETRDDATEVWIAVEAQWEAEEKADSKWIDEMLVERFYGWSNDSPAPRSKASTEKWDRFNDEQGNIVAHELYPLEIVVYENTAVVHYLYTSAYRDKDGKVETNNGRYTDILVRTPDGWKFVGWHGGED